VSSSGGGDVWHFCAGSSDAMLSRERKHLTAALSATCSTDTPELSSSLTGERRFCFRLLFLTRLTGLTSPACAVANSAADTDGAL